MVRIKMKATDGPGMWRKLGLPRPIPSNSDEEAMENPPPIPRNIDTEPAAGPETRRSDSPDVQTYRRRKRAMMIEPPPSSPTVAMETQAGETPQEDTLSASRGQKRPRMPSPPPPPSPEQEPETPIATHPAGHEESGLPNSLPSDLLSDLPSDLPKPIHPDHITQALTFNKVSERARLDRVSSLPYHPGPIIPRHERVFRRRTANQLTTTQQTAHTDTPAESEQKIQEEAPPATPQ
ncbi:cell surface glycoprotein 1-like [Manihot esculenta]|uniref:cell surface glycoprotein 1-like n=1 Tax=Manihot esculenta TaxID=3983 RepID=UPI000B5D2B5C|nr:cell surface glycoprotein 1-like [Manihot esculenta]